MESVVENAVYMVTGMLCNDKIGYHGVDCPVAFRTVDEAIEYARNDIGMRFTKQKGYEVDEVAEDLDGSVKRLRVYFNGGFAEYRIDAIDIPI